MTKKLLILFIIGLFCSQANAQSSSKLTAKDYLNYYKLASMQQSDELLTAIHEKIVANTELNDTSVDYNSLKKVDDHYTNYLKFKKTLLYYMSGKTSAKDLDTRILSTLRVGQVFDKETASEEDKKNYDQTYGQSYLEGFFSQNDQISSLTDWQKFIYESYGQALENAIISYVKILSLEKEVYDADDKISTSIIDEIWEKFDRFLPVHNPKLDNGKLGSSKNNKLSYVSTDVVSKANIEDPRKKIWDKIIQEAIVKAAKNTKISTGSVLAETVKQMQAKAMDINAALQKANAGIANYPDVYNENVNALTLFKITQSSLETVPEYKEYISKYLDAVAEGPGLLLVTKTMSDESDENPYHNAAIGGLRTADNFERFKVKLPEHNIDPELINTKFVKEAIFEAENNVILSMADFKNTITDAKSGDKQLNYDVLMDLLKFFPEAVALAIDKHPEYNTDEVVISIASSIVSIDAIEESKDTNRKVWMWAGIAVGAVCLATGILSWAGAGLITASVSTAVAVSATVFGLMDTKYQYDQMNDHEHNYNLLHSSYLSGNTGVQSVKEAKMEMLAFENSRLAYYISGGVSILNVSVFLVDLKYLALAKQATATMSEADAIKEIAKNIDRYKMAVAGKLYSNVKFTEKLLATGEDPEKFILSLSRELSLTKNVEEINKQTMKAINKVLGLDDDVLKDIVKTVNSSPEGDIIPLLKAEKEVKIATEISKGMDWLKAQLNDQKIFDNFMRYFNETVSGKEANSLLRIQSVETSSGLVTNIKGLKFLSQEYSPENVKAFEEFLKTWKGLSYVGPDLNYTASGPLRLISIYQESEGATGDFILFLAQPENKAILLKLLEIADPMSIDGGWAFLSSLDKAGPFIDKLRILKNEPEAASEILQEIKDIMSKTPSNLLKADGSLDTDILCAMVDKKIAEIGPITQDLISSTPKDDIISMMYFPKNGANGTTHTELVFGDKTYSTDGYFFTTSDVEKWRLARYLNPGKFDYFKINIKVSEEEALDIEKMITKMSSDPNYHGSCVGTTSRIINKSTSMMIPYPLSQSPTVSAMYLKVIKTLGYERITSIEFVGENQLKSLLQGSVAGDLGLFTFCVGGVVGVGTTIGALIIKAIDPSGNEDSFILQHTITPNYNSPKDKEYRPFDYK
ncbi:MAG: hypothetical protein WCQ53_03425 [bacterium]